MLDYMIYLLAFAVGSILGLLFSYKQHGEPYVANAEFNMVAAVVAILGWCLAFCSGNVILSGIGFLLGGFIMGERPGYGRKETAVGIIIALALVLIIKLTV